MSLHAEDFPLFHFPFDIYLRFRHLLTTDEYRSLMNINKEMYSSQVRVKTIKLKLNPDFSILYQNDPEFRAKALRLVADPHLQIYLTLTQLPADIATYYQDLSIYKLKINLFPESICLSDESQLFLHNFRRLHNLDLCTYGGTDFPFIPSLYKLTIRRSTTLRSVEHCSHLNEVNLTHCSAFSDVKPLKDVPILSFSSCNQITNITPLGNHDKVSFIWCSGIIDLTPLAVVHKEVFICNCEKVTHIDCLENVPIVNIRFNDRLDYLPRVFNQKKFSINTFHPVRVPSPTTERFDHLTEHWLWKRSFSPQFSTPFQAFLVSSNFQEILLSNCWIEDHHLQAFSSCVKVTLDVCLLLRDLSALGNGSVEYLEIKGLRITHLKGLASIAKIKITQCHQLESLDGLQAEQRPIEKRHISTVFIDTCNNLRDFSALTAIHTVKILNCIHFHDISDLAQVSFITIQTCPSLRSITMEKSQHLLDCECISLRDCWRLSDVSGIQHIPIILLQKCFLVRELILRPLQVTAGYFYFQQVQVENCAEFRSIEGELTEIYSLKIVDCPNFLKDDDDEEDDEDDSESDGEEEDELGAENNPSLVNNLPSPAPVVTSSREAWRLSPVTTPRTPRAPGSGGCRSEMKRKAFLDRLKGIIPHMQYTPSPDQF